MAWRTCLRRAARLIIELYNVEDLDRFLTGKRPFDVVYDRA